ncbi:hypothetical protein Cni_G00239 [Canna indica]|uniref:DUF220 domain-containing protein n=1 Tax=Canna indica TaxID=4628 RepID=A0AAQ3JKU0_9LILI|nr:hypothetical protein Cni_G00239 [Canna indica]
MADIEMGKLIDTTFSKGKECTLAVSSAVGNLVQFQQNLHNSLKTHLRQLVMSKQKNGARSLMPVEKESPSVVEANYHKQLEAWRENPSWVDQPPKIKVSVPKGSLCNLNVMFKVGLPPDAIYNIVVDPENKRVFKNIKEVISRKVLVDEGFRQVVEVEQAALWRFLWWSGTISVHVIVEQNRKDRTVKFKQGKTGFMKRFEGSWKVEPIFVDEHVCSSHKPKTWEDYNSCTQGKGRVGSIVSLDQLIQPALVPPPPISWYLRGITTRTTEMLISDLLAEAARLRCAIGGAETTKELEASEHENFQNLSWAFDDIKKRWHLRRKERHHKNRRNLMAN